MAATPVPKLADFVVSGGAVAQAAFLVETINYHLGLVD